MEGFTLHDLTSQGPGSDARPASENHDTYVFEEEFYGETVREFLSWCGRASFREDRPMSDACIMGLRRGIRMLGLQDVTQLPIDLQYKAEFVDYRLSEDASGISWLSLEQKSALVLYIAESFHEAWAMTHAGDILPYRSPNAGRYLPFVLSGEAGLERFLDDDLVRLYGKFELGEALAPTSRLGMPAPLCREMFFDARDAYCRRMGLESTKDLSRFVKSYFPRHFGELAPSATQAIAHHNDIAMRFVGQVLQRNRGYFRS